MFRWLFSEKIETCLLSCPLPKPWWAPSKKSPKHRVALVVGTVDGRNPKQPPGMYETRRK